MSQNNITTNTSGSVGFFGLFTILFIALKLTGYINWSWIWVLSPLWIGFVIGFFFFVIFFIFIIILEK